MYIEYEKDYLEELYNDGKCRRIGGLGIFLVIKKMDDVRYAYVDNKNVLTVEKIIVPKKTPNTSNTSNT